ncbi:C13 family peptidase [Marinobacterium sp. YM272]|uniref:C13 family peptidase n=1 Tax=Marinobacterium sp. YM272 TaxID=3421654 RepID=UPI003D7F8449
MTEQRREIDKLGANLGGGFRLAFGFSLSKARFHYSLGQLIALVVLLGLLQVVLAFAAVDPPRVFNPYGANYLAALNLGVMLLLLVITRLAGGGARVFGRTLIAVAAAECFMLLGAQLGTGLIALLELPFSYYWAGLCLFLGWQWLVLARALGANRQLARLRVALTAGLFPLGLLASFWVFPQILLWYTDYPEQERAPRAALNVEKIYYAQPQLLAESLSALAPGESGKTELYLLALGGYGEENVFLNEVEYVREQFDTHFGTAGRSLVLANNPATTERYPLANAHNLQSALDALAERMNLNEDLLFLFMTSHGSSDHHFSLQLGDLGLNDLRPVQLREALDKAGIRWRVLLVSSCYSGGFVEALKSPETLVITAAAADRSSFGCGAQSNFTYFGDAYFRQALPREPRFIQAFDLARDWVTQREASESFIPSRPQRFVGAEIETRLRALYRESAMNRAIELAERAEACRLETGRKPCSLSIDRD